MTKHSSHSARARRGNSSGPKTLAEMLFPLGSEEENRELEAFRVEYEKEFGETDLTKHYTSMWPSKHQDWLIDNDTKRYFDGLPPFAKAYIKDKLDYAAQTGMLDNAPDCYLSLYAKGLMKLDHESRGR